MPKVWSLVQNITKIWTSFLIVTKKVSKICPKFGHFFQNVPKKLPKVWSQLRKALVMSTGSRLVIPLVMANQGSVS